MPRETSSESPLVSVIIPTYNRVRLLKDAIASAIRQKYQNIEIIVSDDCSPQNPQEIVESFQDARIRFRRNATNMGMLFNTLIGYKEAQGKYVASLNDDDMWNEDFLEKLVPVLEENSNIVLAFCDHYIVDGEGNINYPETEINTQRWKRNQLKEGIYQPFYQQALVDQSVSIAAASVVRRDAIDWDKFPDEASVLWDLYLGYLACRSGAGAYYYPERLTRYRVHEQSETAISGSKDIEAKLRKGEAQLFCFNQFMADEQLQEFRPYFKHKLSEANTTIGIALLRLQQVMTARPYLWRGFTQEKLSPRNLVALSIGFIPGGLSLGKALKILK